VQVVPAVDGASLYVTDTDSDQPVLRFVIFTNKTLNVRLGGTSGNKIPFQPIRLIDDTGAHNSRNVSAWVFHNKQAINIEDAYEGGGFDFSGTKQFDQNTNYRSQSLLTLPLINHEEDVVGILQLINAQDDHGNTVPFDLFSESLGLALASAAAVTLDTQRLIQSHKDLLDAFVRAIAKAIDAKSAHTSAHCERVPALTEMLARAACNTNTGPLKDFSLTDDEWYELNVAAWLHDCGKLTTPDHILDK